MTITPPFRAADLYAIARAVRPELPEDGRDRVREAMRAVAAVDDVLRGLRPVYFSRAQRVDVLLEAKRRGWAG